MTEIFHSIKYDVINGQGKQFNIDIFINDKLQLSLSETKSSEANVATWNYCYSDEEKIANLAIVLSGEEQQNKLLRIRNIIVNKQPVNIYTGFYYVKDSPWWQSLNADQYKKERRRTVLHGGCLGWFGHIEYSYELVRNKKPGKKQLTYNSMPRLTNNGIII